MSLISVGIYILEVDRDIIDWRKSKGLREFNIINVEQIISYDYSFSVFSVYVSNFFMLY